MDHKDEKIEALYRLIAELKTPEDCRALFNDLCTIKEIEKMAERVYAAKLLMEGKTYNQVIAQADISSATLSRVSRCVQYGQGYSKFLKK
jgi:TrpR-related protein YerC/YecD